MGIEEADGATQLPPGREPLGPARVTLLWVYVGAAVVYLGWRATSLASSSLVFSLAFFAAEACAVAGLLLHAFITRRLSVRPPAPAPPGMSVDVFVTTRDEPLEMLRRTLLAAKSMDYPHETWVLDDGNRLEMRELAKELRVRYIARPIDTGSVAGNLNNALRYSRSAFVAIFDAHHAPARGFLTETLGHFRDGQVAFVQTPLDAYNLDSFGHRRKRRGLVVWNDLTLFSRVVQRGRDCDNAAVLCTSCAVLRRAALDHVNGFAPATLAPALHTSLKLHQAGWQSVYHARSLAFGMAPASIGPFVGRYLRRGQGAMQVWRRERIALSRRLTAAQKIAYLDDVLAYGVGWRKAAFYLAPIVVLTTGALPTDAPVAVFAAAFAAFHLLGLWVRQEIGRGYANLLGEEQYHMARFAASITATLVPAPSAAARAERTRTAGKTWPFVLPQGALLIASAVAIPAGIGLYAKAGALPLAALAGAAIWAAANAALAGSVLALSARVAAFRRRDYRFRVPVPARLRFADDGPVLGIFDDVSSSGFKFYGPFPQRVSVGSRFTGHLFMPSGRVAFAAVVRAEMMAFGGGHAKGIGCSFEWSSNAARNALERYLYGTDLQWAVNELEDRTPTMLERLAHAATLARKQSPAPHWAPVLYQHAANTLVPPHVGFVSLPAEGGEGPRLATLEPLDIKLPLRLRIVTRTGSRSVVGRAVPMQRVETPANPVFLYRLAS